MQALFELVHYDGPTQFIGVRYEDKQDMQGKPWQLPHFFYGVVQSVGGDDWVYDLWSLPPKSTEPEFTLKDSEVDWSEME